MIERHLRVQRSARFYVLGTTGADTRELWVACHGYGQLAAGFAQVLETIANDERAIVVPEALSRFYRAAPGERTGPDTPAGASWMTREDREYEITDNIEYLDAVATLVRGEIPSPDVRLTAFGFSQGVATICRWVARGVTRVNRMILWGGNLAQDLQYSPNVFHGASVTLVAGRSDAVMPADAVEQARTRLRDQRIESDLVQYDGGHLLKRAILEQLAAVSPVDRGPSP